MAFESGEKHGSNVPHTSRANAAKPPSHTLTPGAWGRGPAGRRLPSRAPDLAQAAPPANGPVTDARSAAARLLQRHARAWLRGRKERSRAAARRLLGLAAAQGHASAQYELGRMHYLGDCGPQDYAEARRLLELAVAQGHADAQEMLSLLRGKGKGQPTAEAKAALAESRRAEKLLEAERRREQEAKQTAAAAVEQERLARESASVLAAEKVRRAAAAAALEENRRRIASETAAKLAAEQAAAEAALVLVREKAALAEAAERVESRKALAARKAAAAEQAQRAEEAKRANGAEEEAKQRAKQKDAADAKKAAKQEKKVRKKAPSAFQLQHEQEERAREEQRAEELRAKELAAEQEWQRDALRAERGAVELMAAERESAELTRGGLSRSSSEVTASPALAQPDSAGRSQDSLVGEATLRGAMRSVSISEAPSSAQQVLFLTLANAGDITGRNDAPESSIGGETTCIVCMAAPKTHLAVPCAHQCACGTCAAQMQLCPYCRAPVHAWFQVRVV